MNKCTTPPILGILHVLMFWARTTFFAIQWDGLEGVSASSQKMLLFREENFLRPP